jgi:hypothetical protein
MRSLHNYVKEQTVRSAFQIRDTDLEGNWPQVSGFPQYGQVFQSS